MTAAAVSADADALRLERENSSLLDDQVHIHVEDPLQAVVH